MADLRIDDFTGGETDEYRDCDPRFCLTAYNFNINEQKDLITRPGFKAIDDAEPDPFIGQAINKIWHHRTRRPTLAGSDDKRHKYETFITSNGAVRRYDPYENAPNWRTVQTPADNGGSGLNGEADVCRFTIQSQGNYVRLNDNEFVMIADAVSVGTPIRPLKFYRENSVGEWKYVSLGLPRHDNDNYPIATSEINPGAGTDYNFSYAIVLKHTYTLYEAGVGTITKIVRGAPSYTPVQTYTDGVDIQIPEFDRTELTTRWIDGDGEIVGNRTYFDYANTVIEIYRTDDNGTIWYYWRDVEPSGPITGQFPSPFIPGDRVLRDLSGSYSANAALYTTGGIFGSDMSNNRIRYATFANDCLWLASTSRVWQSKSGIYDAIPGSFQFNLREGEYITGINTIDVYPIVFTNQGVYRIEGIVDDLGNGAHRVRTVSEDNGAVSNKTTVKAKSSIFFWSDDGFYETNGYQAKKVSDHYDDRFNLLNGLPLTDLVNEETYNYYLAEGVYDEINQRVTWMYPDGEPITIPPGINIDDRFNRNMVTMHIKYAHPQGYAITSGRTEITINSIDAHGGDIYAVTEFGAALKQDANTYTDTDIFSGIGAVQYMIKWTYISGSYSFGTSRVRKWFTKILMNFKKRTNLNARLFSTSDEENDDWREHFPITKTKTDEGEWFIKRWFKRGQIRGTYKMIRIEDDDVQNQSVQISDITIQYSGAGEGHTEDGRT